MYLDVFTERAVITNITPNHLNWHTSFEEYKQAKLSLLSHTRGAVLCLDDGILSETAKKRYTFALTSTEKSYEKIKESYDFSVAYTLESSDICRNGVPYIPIGALSRREKHNIKNFMSALAACDGVTSRAHALRVANEFHGLPHRCEHFAAVNGVDYFNSSIDTSPERTVATLSSLGRRCFVILGGRSNGLPFEKLVPFLQIYAKEAVLYGECADEIMRVISGRVRARSFCELYDAVRHCISAASPGDAVILSPAATSYDSFSSFEERGDFFKKTINECTKQDKCK
jgi:UDP-N-acetylmuramoylalanine--D-glutamate ligase